MNWNNEFMQLEMNKLQDIKQKWIEQRIDMGGDKAVIQFIANILFHGGNGVTAEDSIETTRSLFEAGYCYYFAKMLEDAFPGGQACYCYNFGHIVYCYEGVAYDIGGVSDAEHEMYIPLKAFGAAVNDFRHIPGLEYNLSKDELVNIGEKCWQNGEDVCAISAYDKEIVDRSRAVCEEFPEAKYVPYKISYNTEKSRLIKNLNDGYIVKEQFDEFMKQYCDGIGLSYPLILRFERDKELDKETKMAPEELMQKLVAEVKEEQER